jgi:hypothetical protein
MGSHSSRAHGCHIKTTTGPKPSKSCGGSETPNPIWSGLQWATTALQNLDPRASCSIRGRQIQAALSAQVPPTPCTNNSWLLQWVTMASSLFNMRAILLKAMPRPATMATICGPQLCFKLNLINGGVIRPRCSAYPLQPGPIIHSASAVEYAFPRMTSWGGWGAVPGGRHVPVCQ